MATISFTANLKRHVECPPMDIAAGTLRELLESYFENYPDVRGYVLNDQRGVRHHMVIFVDGEQAKDRAQLSDALQDGSEVFVFQALSGG